MQIHWGTVPQNAQVPALQKLIDSHPFTHRLDVVLTASEDHARRLASFETSYYRSKITFSELFLTFSTSKTVFTLGSALDFWCVDIRGILSLSLTSETYERLGIGIGTRIGSGVVNVRFLIKLDLHDRTSSLVARARSCLEQWDVQRAAQGQVGWDVLLSSPNPEATRPEAKLNVPALLETMANAHIPSHILPEIKSDDAQDEFADLCEWVGLASLGSQRLLVEDSVRSYAAFYEPPSASSVGTIFHLCWCGFISPGFVHLILQEVLMSSGGVRAMSALSFDTPVSYISSSGATRAGENVWTLIVSETEAQGEKQWVLGSG